jgi:uncharacterized protein YbjT (DUF2867 family)
MRDHAATEAILQASGIAFTSLCNGFYAESAVMLMGKALGTGKLVAPDDGPLSRRAPTDLAESAVMAPTGKGHLEELTLSLTRLGGPGPCRDCLGTLPAQDHACNSG